MDLRHSFLLSPLLFLLLSHFKKPLQISEILLNLQQLHSGREHYSKVSDYFLIFLPEFVISSLTLALPLSFL